MAETQSDRHDRLAELMVVVESTMLAALELQTKLYGKSPAHASIFLESALHRATERFAEKN